MADQRYDVSEQQFQDLADRLQQLAEQLPDDERTVLTSILVLAGKQLESVEAKDVQGFGTPGTGYSVQLGNIAAFQTNFALAFDRFRPGAFGTYNPGGIRAGTICVE
jgi:hypothetical protein